MTIWTVTTTVVYSGLPFVDGDSFTVNSPGDLTADQDGAAGANCTVNTGGTFNVSAGVNALFNSGGSFRLTVSEGGAFYPIGTSGNNAVIGGDVGTDADVIVLFTGSLTYAEYATFQYMSNANSIACSTAIVYLKNTTLSHLGTSSIRNRYGTLLTLDTVIWGDSDSSFCISHEYSGSTTIIDCTMLANTAWLLGVYRGTVNLLGTNTIDIGGGAVEPDNTNDTGTFVEDYRYRPKMVLSETNNESSCVPNLIHPEQSEGILTNAVNKLEYDAFRPFDNCDANGDVTLYPLQKTFFDGTWKYWSDSGEAETGDNQKFTFKLGKTGFVPNTGTAWADDATKSVELTALAGATIDSVTLSDSNISETEETTITVVTDDVALVVVIDINSTQHEVSLSTTVGSVKTWVETIKGSDVGTVSAGTVTVYASSATTTATDTSATLTVTAATQTYAPMIKDALNSIRDKMRNASGSYAYLSALGDNNIVRGERFNPTNDYREEGILVNMMVDHVEDITMRTQESNFKVSIVYFVKGYKDPDSDDDVIDMVGDIYDLFMPNANRTLDGEVSLLTVVDMNFDFNNEGNEIIRWCEIICDARHQHVVS